MTDPIEKLKQLVDRWRNTEPGTMDPSIDTADAVLCLAADELAALLPKLEQHIQAAVEAEREACAELANYTWIHHHGPAAGQAIAEAIRSRGSSDALKEMLSQRENDVDGFWIDLVEEAIHVGIIPETKEAAIEAIKYALAEAREESYKRGYNDRAEAECVQTHGKDRTVLCRKCGTPVVFLCKNTAEALAEARKQGRMEEAHWWEHLVRAVMPDHPEGFDPECIYCKRIAELESDHGKSEG